jgi:RNA polymerase sigma-70 factor (ECF subfamily)
MREPTADLREQIVELLPRLRRFARTLARNAHDADDVVQIAVERALARLDQLRPGSALSSWLFGIVRNAWIDQTRGHARQARIFADEELGARVGEDSLANVAETLAVQKALARLPEEQRAAVGLVLVEGLSYKEAARIMEVPVGTLTSRLARAREALQEMLSDTTGEPS